MWRPILLYECCEAGCYDFVKKLQSASNLFAVCCFLGFRKTALLYKLGKTGDVFWEKYRVVDEFLVALVTKHNRRSFLAPWAVAEYSLSFRSPSVSRSTEEPFSNAVMLGCMTTSL